MKSTKSEKDLVSMGQTGVEGLPLYFIRFIGITELAGTLGIVLPWLFQTQPVLTPVTAGCFCLVMLLAAAIHTRRKEYKAVMANVFIFLVALLVAYYRFRQVG